MKIHPILPIKRIRIRLKDKTMNPDGDTIRSPSKMGTIEIIADKNKVGLFVAEDVVLLGSSQKLQKDLKEANIDFTIEGES